MTLGSFPISKLCTWILIYGNIGMNLEYTMYQHDLLDVGNIYTTNRLIRTPTNIDVAYTRSILEYLFPYFLDKG